MSVHTIHPEDQELLNRFIALAPNAQPGTSQWRYRLHPNGAVRWLWPAESQRPVFLSLWHTISMRARCQADAV